MSNFRKSDVMAGHAKSIAVMLAIASAILLLSGCAALGQPPAVSAKPLVFAIDAWPPAWYFDVASEKGYLARENASVEIIRFNGSYSELLEFFTENRSIDCTEMASPDLLNLREKGVNVQAIIPIDRSIGSDVLVANPNITSVAQLRGKRVGYAEFNSAGHMFVVRLLEKYNMSESDVQMQLVPMEEIPIAIAEGRLDAGHTFEPITFQALAMGQREIGDSTELPPMIFDVIACRKGTLDSRRDDVQKAVNAWFAAKAFEQKDGAGAHAIMERANNMPSADFESYYAGNEFYGYYDGMAAFSDTGQNGIISAINNTRNFMMERGQTSGGVQPEELVNRSFMQNVKWGQS